MKTALITLTAIVALPLAAYAQGTPEVRVSAASGHRPVADAVAAVPPHAQQDRLAGKVPPPEHGHQPLLPAYLPVSLAVLRQFLQRFPIFRVMQKNTPG